MNQPGANDRHVFGLDIPRATAIIFVLLAHTWPSGNKDLQWPGAFGMMGVEIFFVLSGYLIGGILIRLADTGKLNRMGDVWQFWKRRWFRTLPNYFLFLFLRIIWRWFLWNGSIALTFDNGVAAVSYLALFKPYYFFVQNLLHPPADWFFIEAWSLTVEEWFYLLFPLLLWIALRSFANRHRGLLLVIGLFLFMPVIGRLLVFMGWMFDVNLYSGFGESVRLTAVYRLDTIAYGVAAAYVAVRHPGIWMKAQKLWPVSIGLVVLSIFSLATHFPLDHRIPAQWMILWPLMAFSIALLMPALSNWREQKGHIASVVGFVARISYSLYLCHGLVVIVLATWFGPKSFLYLPKHSIAWMISVWIISVLVAWMAYRWFERPIMDLRDRNSRKSD